MAAWSKDELGAHDLDLADDVDNSSGEVHLVHGEPEDLTLAEPASGPGIDRGPVLLRQGVPHREHAVGGPRADLARVRLGDSDTPGPARVAGDQAIIDGRREHGGDVGEDDSLMRTRYAVVVQCSRHCRM